MSNKSLEFDKEYSGMESLNEIFDAMRDLGLSGVESEHLKFFIFNTKADLYQIVSSHLNKLNSKPETEIEPARDFEQILSAHTKPNEVVFYTVAGFEFWHGVLHNQPCGVICIDKSKPYSDASIALLDSIDVLNKLIADEFSDYIKPLEKILFEKLKTFYHEIDKWTLSLEAKVYNDDAVKSRASGTKYPFAGLEKTQQVNCPTEVNIKPKYLH